MASVRRRHSSGPCQSAACGNPISGVWRAKCDPGRPSFPDTIPPAIPSQLSHRHGFLLGSHEHSGLAACPGRPREADTYHTLPWHQLLQHEQASGQVAALPALSTMGEQAEQLRSTPVVPAPVEAEPLHSDSASESDSGSDSSLAQDIDLFSLEWVVPAHPASKIHRAHPEQISIEGFSRPLCCTVKGISRGKEPALLWLWLPFPRNSGVKDAALMFFAQ